MTSTTPRLLLISGIPGTGKTTLGSHLHCVHNFLHVDREIVRWCGTTASFVAERHRRRQDAVVTWGFMPGQDDGEVRELQALGLRLIWCDGDRAAALRYFNQRGDVSEELFHAQLKRLERFDVGAFCPYILNPFHLDGQLRAVEDLASELLSLFP